MKINILKTGLTVALLIGLLMPPALFLSGLQDDPTGSDAAHLIEPMLRLYTQSAVNCADAAVAPMMDIEDVWALEDMRSEAGAPLITGMRNGDSALGYDAGSQTFYCTVGAPGETWPSLDLYAESADPQTPVNVAWVDDYTFDYPPDSVADGYRYELFAYTQSEYQYLGLVFTGLPIVTLHTESEIPDEYVPACVSVSAADEQALTSIAQVHTRGGGYLKPFPKHSYRIEFQELTHTGRVAARDASVLGMAPDSDWILLSNSSNKESIYNYLSFDLWNRWNGDQHLFMQLQSRMVELFVGDEYMGLYQLTERIDPEQEILDAGGNPDTDMAVRIIAENNASDKPLHNVSSSVTHKYEYLYAPGENADSAFSAVEDYSLINEWLGDPLTDEVFTQIIEERVDVENFISYFLFSQVTALPLDNVTNNCYIYMLRENGKTVYHLGPWDMDSAFLCGYFTSETEDSSRFAPYLKSVIRMLDLDIMNSREILHKMFDEKRETILSDHAITQWITETESMIVSSGAYLRETEKWYKMPSAFDLSTLLTFELEQIAFLDEYIGQRWPL